MIEVARIADPLMLQIISDAMRARGVIFRVEQQGVSAMMPLILEARIIVNEEDLQEAAMVLADHGFESREGKVRL